MPERFSTYLRDLRARQNRNVTEAQLHLYLTAKRYTNKEILEAIKYMKGENKDKNQQDIEGNPIKDEIIKRHKSKIDELREELLEKEDKIKELEQTIYDLNAGINTKNVFKLGNKVILVDSEQKVLKLWCKEDLFDDIITEFNKLVEWLDVHAAYFKFDGIDSEEYIIDKGEIETTVNLLEKFNKMRNG